MPGSSKTERKSRLMVNHILLTFAALKLIQRDKTEIATVATKNQGTAAKKYVTWSGMDLAQLHAEVQTDFDNLDVSKLSLHNQRLIAKVQRQWTLSQAAANEPWPEVQAPPLEMPVAAVLAYRLSYAAGVAPAADGGGNGGGAPFPAQIP